MAKSSTSVRSVADEPVTVGEFRPEPVRATVEDDHPALDPGPMVTATDTQNAREMNMPADRPGVPYTGTQLEVTPPVESPPVSSFSGEGLLTINQVEEQRIAP